MAKLRKKAAVMLYPDREEEEMAELEDAGQVMPDRSKPVADPLREAEKGAASLRAKVDELKKDDKPRRKKERLGDGIEVEYEVDDDEPVDRTKKPKSLRQRMVRAVRGQ